MKTKTSRSIFTDILIGFVITIGILAVIFFAGRYGWKLGGFQSCQSAGIESVKVTENSVSIKGFYPGSFPQGFLGYHAEEKDGTLYVGFKFSGIFGIFETGNFDITIPTKSEVREVIIKTAKHEFPIWPSADQEPGASEDEPTNPVTPSTEPVTEPTAPVTEPTAPVTGPTEPTPPATEPPVVSGVYDTLIEQYHTMLSEKWNIGQAMSAGLNYMLIDNHHGNPLEEIGYTILDLDEDGTEELIIGSMIEDDFFGKMIFAMYTQDDENQPLLLIDCTERNRYYYAGDIRFANIGSSGADGSFDTTLKLQEKELIDMTRSVDPANYVQMELTPFSDWGK